MSNLFEGRAASPWSKISWRVGSTLTYIVMVIFALMTLYPIIWTIMNSFKPTPEFMMNRSGLPISPTLDNFVGAWKLGDFDKLILNSVLYTVLTTVALSFLSVMAGFAFAKIPNKATPTIYNSFLMGIMITITTLMVPLFLLEANFPSHDAALYNTYWGVLIPYIGIGLPQGIYLCTQYIKQIPTALVESARIDGAGYFRIFISIIFPMTMPVIVTLSLLTVINTWNEFALVNILVRDTAFKSLPLGILRFSGSLSSDWGKQFAALTVGLLPMLVFYLAFRRQITKGVAGGAVKG